MPTYDYECTNEKCGHAFELFQSMTASPKRKCPECGQLKLRRLIGTGAGVIFRGSGFYQTDYRSDAYKKAAEAEKPSSSGEGSKNGDGGSGKKAKPGESSKPSGKGTCGSGSCACGSSQ